MKVVSMVILFSFVSVELLPTSFNRLLRFLLLIPSLNLNNGLGIYQKKVLKHGQNTVYIRGRAPNGRIPFKIRSKRQFFASVLTYKMSHIAFG